MEDILDVYVQPYDQKRPQVCFDEGSMQFKESIIEPIEAKSGKVKKIDYHYKRDGYCSIFMACEPLTGKRAVEVRERRTKADFAHFAKYIVDEMYPAAEQIILVMDNLSTHSLGALYQNFPAEEAKRLCKKIELHYTPVHGSWLNMAEIELSVLGRQVLHERIRDMETVQKKVAAWQAKRNAQQTKINWRFTTEDARIKLKRLYPSFEGCDLPAKETE
jgi:DDE superfamily endonuclease